MKRSTGILALCTILLGASLISLAGCLDFGDREREQWQKASIEAFLAGTNSTIHYDSLLVSAKDKSFTMKNVRGTFTVQATEIIPGMKGEFRAAELKASGVNFVNAAPAGPMDFAAKVALTNSTVKVTNLAEKPVDFSTSESAYATLSIANLKGDFSTFKALFSGAPLTEEQRKGLLAFSASEIAYEGYTSKAVMPDFETVMSGESGPETATMIVESTAKSGFMKDLNASGVGEHRIDDMVILLDGKKAASIAQAGGKAMRLPGLFEALLNPNFVPEMFVGLVIEFEGIYVDGLVALLPTGEQVTMKRMEMGLKFSRVASAFFTKFQSITLPDTVTDMAGDTLLMTQKPLSSFHTKPLSFSGELAIDVDHDGKKTNATIDLKKFAFFEDSLGGFNLSARLLSPLTPDTGSSSMLERMDEPSLAVLNFSMQDKGLLDFLFSVAVSTPHTAGQGVDDNPRALRVLVASLLSMGCEQTMPPFAKFCSDIARYINEPNLFELTVAPEAPLACGTKPETLMRQTPQSLGLTWKYTPPAAPAAPAK